MKRIFGNLAIVAGLILTSVSALGNLCAGA